VPSAVDIGLDLRVGLLAPLTATQRRFFLAESLGRNTADFMVGVAFRIVGELDVDCVALAFRDVIRRHEAFRTAFEWGEEGPLQRICSAPDIFKVVHQRVQQIDFDGEEVWRAIYDPLEIAKAPLLRITVIQTESPGRLDSILVMASHHLVCDQRGLLNGVRDMNTFYSYYKYGSSFVLPALRMQLADYAQKEAERGWSPSFEERQYWEGSRQFLRTLALPANPCRSHLDPRQGHLESHIFPDEVFTAVRDLARNHQTTVFRTVALALYAVLARFSGRSTVGIAVTMSHAASREIVRTVGLFTSPVIVGLKLLPDDTFPTLLASFDETLKCAQAYSQSPLEQVIRKVLGPTEQFQPIHFTFSHDRKLLRPSVWCPEWQVERLPIPSPNPSQYIGFHAHESGDCLTAMLKYSRDFLGRDQARSLLQSWQTVLTAWCVDPGQCIKAISLGDKINSDPGYGKDEGPQSFSLPQLSHDNFNEALWTRSRLDPSKIALKTREHAVDLTALVQRALELAALLPLRTNGPEPVALLFWNDDPDLIIALVAVLFAGHAFVALDVEHPDKRLVEILASSGSISMLYGRSLEKRASKVGGQMLKISSDMLSDSPLLHPYDVSGDDMAYLMYTSGSTGTPKGVIQNHRHLVHFADAFARCAGGICAADTVSLLTNAAHDAGLMDIFLALLHGGPLVPMNIKRIGIGAALDLIQDMRVNVVHTTPSFFRAWMSCLDGRRFESDLRLVVFDGEPSTKGDVQAFFRHFPQTCRLMNCYGSTESSISLFALVEHNNADLVGVGAFSLTGPAARTSIDLMTEVGSQQMVTGIGEIVVESAFVSPGYWKQPQLTAETFERLDNGRSRYFTGDLGRLLPHGGIEVVGRKDRQIKVSGQRVDLEEVEDVFRQMSGTHEVCVLAPEQAKKTASIEAYWVAKIDSPSGQSIRERMSECLPGFMVPGRIVSVPKIPCTSNGKIDIHKLRQIGVNLSDKKTSSVALEPQQKTVVELWRKILKLKEVRPHHNWFALGGDSLGLLNLQHQLEALGYRIDVGILFSDPTLQAHLKAMTKTERLNLSRGQKRGQRRQQSLRRRERVKDED
jgi:amino acid adenylation domain-containing protein